MLLRPRASAGASGGGGSGGAIVPAQRWRVYIHSNAQDVSYYTYIGEIEMRGSVGGPDLTHPDGIVSASSFLAGCEPYRAFDDLVNSSGTADGTYYSTAYQGAARSWIEYDFGVEVSLAEAALAAARNVNYAPQDFEIQYWNGSAWISVWGTKQTGWALGEWRSFPLAEDAWRLALRGETSSTGYQIAEVDFRTVAGVRDTSEKGPIAGTIFNSLYSAAAAFDGNASSRWVSRNGTAGELSTEHLGACYLAMHPVVEVAVTAGPSTGATASPISIDFQRCIGGGWVTQWSHTGLTWANGETKIFTNPGA